MTGVAIVGPSEMPRLRMSREAADVLICTPRDSSYQDELDAQLDSMFLAAVDATTVPKPGARVVLASPKSKAARKAQKAARKKQREHR